MHVAALHTAPTYGAPTVSLNEIVAVKGKGVEGDRYFGTTRQMTIVSTGELSSAAGELGIDAISDGATRRNITVVADELPRQHGAEIHIGEVTLEIWRDCAPCELMETTVGPGAKTALKGRSGISTTVTKGGTIRLGDPVSF
jgi:MOSC domain-containing protein YiiM